MEHASYVDAEMKKTALASCMLLLLWLSMFQSISSVKANPAPYPEEPNQELPTIKVNSPKNAQAFTTTTVEVNFTVAKPESWNIYWLTTMPVISSYLVDIYLDGSFHSQLVDPGSSGFPNANYSVFLNKLGRGGHSVKIEVEAFTFYNDPSPESGDYLTYPKNISETVHFKVNADLPTPFPTLKATPKAGFFQSSIVIAVIVIAAVIGLGLLVCFKKRQRDKSP